MIETLYKVRMTYSVSGLAMAAGLAALDDHEHVEKCVKMNRLERDFLSRELSRLRVTYVPSSTNFILMDVGKPADEVGDALLREGMMVRPLGAWGIPTGLRVSIGTHEQNERFLTALEKVL